jgi:hypothetical protein
MRDEHNEQEHPYDKEIGYMKMYVSGAVAAAAAAAFFFLAGMAAGEPVLTFDQNTGRNVGNGPFSIGWTFDVLEPLTVTGLGWYNQGGDGLEAAHMVGIWGPGPDYALLQSVTVPAGTAASMSGPFRNVPIPQITLAPGKGYTVGGQTATGLVERIVGGDTPFSTVSQSVDFRVTFVAPVTTVGDPSFTRPSFRLGDWGFYGPSFSVVPAPPTPTPAPDPLVINVSATSVKAGDRFTLGIALNKSITQQFDFYLIASTPAGVFTLTIDGKIVPGIQRLYKNIPSFSAPFLKTVWNGITVPGGLHGTVTFYAGVVEAAKVPPVKSLDELTSSTQYMIMFDKESVTVQ